ncbi:conserved hypothetical protein [Talaromyces stipitatus ATCC 10500]|uniref:HTH CENPB-type domain-containing protein n=1 Tax=Talaromyces stipitatus (strain ATCC 10500 / CBS 375.48 / QM 6759 / NRRL 1006) TaxID=441959 RepID=B8LUA9_TALSN|nr:uncharacterized protein TSTA_060730 [Talaromyces stipitatus ATCC 10500]EED22581.1 conserved hypothetical protein [Talaromyces stipitatus ATCC 10500]
MLQQRAQRRRKAIPNEWKAALRAPHRINHHLTHQNLRKWFEDTYNQPIDRATVTRILSSKYAFIDELQEYQLKDKRHRVEQWPELEKAVMDWIRLAETEAPISQEAIRYKAQQYWDMPARVLIIQPKPPVPLFSSKACPTCLTDKILSRFPPFNMQTKKTVTIAYRRVSSIISYIIREHIKKMYGAIQYS